MAREARVGHELNQMKRYAPPNCSVQPVDDNLYQWNAWVIGPEGTPYEGGKFQLRIKFPENYPFSPPDLKFVTKIYHCNIGRNGQVCLDILAKEWSPVMSMAGILLSISALMADCNPQDPMDAEIAKEYRHHRKKHDANAKTWTELYAKPPSKRSKAAK